MQGKIYCVLLICFGLSSAAYRSARIDADDFADGTVAAELRVIEDALLARQQNFALKSVRNLIKKVGNTRLPSSSGSADAESDPEESEPLPPARTGGSTSSPTPPPAAPSSTPPPPPNRAIEPERVESVSPTQFSRTRFAELKEQVDALARPFKTIDDLWDDDDVAKQKECVRVYKAQLDAVVLWITRHAGFFVLPEWKGLVAYAYEKLVSYSFTGGMTNPIKISRFGEGISGKLYYSVYDQVVGALTAIMLKFSPLYEDEIKDVIKRVEVAREASWGGKQ
ncbi:hypothetical protein FJ366_03335 [Candidatus Dependentiae bacterium]|nr:hypothetical protein [Candidatus Dependentiae bacterium]